MLAVAGGGEDRLQSVPSGAQTEHLTWVSQDQVGVTFARLWAVLGRNHPWFWPFFFICQKLTQSNPG